jgi:hypothetical protein
MSPEQRTEANRLLAEWKPNPEECEAFGAKAENLGDFRVGSGTVLPTRSRAGLLPGVEQTRTDESGPLAAELQLSGV